MNRNIRQQQEELEKQTLSPHACLSSQSRGRMSPTKGSAPCELRTVFQCDRDRILHSKTFRRLKHKTQVFLAPTGDHYRTRLTHVLEVSQIARTMAVCLRLNEYLTEAIALGHDLGHTPFGHAGEFCLNELHPKGFKHYQQSLRIVDFLENSGKGLNLSWEVRNGIVKHSKGKGPILPRDTRQLPATLEGQLVRVADIMAYVNHDLDDAIRGNMVQNSDLPQSIRQILGERSTERINAMIADLVQNTLAVDDGALHLSERATEAINELRSFLYDNVYRHEKVHHEFEKAQRIIRDLYGYFLQYGVPEDGTKGFTRFWEPGANQNPDAKTHRKVCDFIAGMTDRYALGVYSKIFMPTPWSTL